MVIAAPFCPCSGLLSFRPPFVIADSIRNPVAASHWIPDVETPDLIRGRDDKTRHANRPHEPGLDAQPRSYQSRLWLTM